MCYFLLQLFFVYTKTYGRRPGEVGFDATRLTSTVSCYGHNPVSVPQHDRLLSSTISFAQCEAKQKM